LVALGLHFEEDRREEESGDYGPPSHHLVNRAGHEVEGHYLESRGDEVTDGGDSE
jgi:hypothetical protein